MNQKSLVSLALALGASPILLSACVVADVSEVGQISENLFSESGVTLWNGATSSSSSSLGNGVTIDVCFMVAPGEASNGTTRCNGATAFKDCLGTSLTSAERSLVRDKVRKEVESSWTRYGDIEFIGWGDCPLSSGKHKDSVVGQKIAIQLSHVVPAVSGACTSDAQCTAPQTECDETAGQCIASPVDWSELGRQNGRPTYLQYNWPAVLNGNEFNIIHEFGHALGFSHEWIRPDWTNSRCNDPSRNGQNFGTSADDLASIMEYCNGTGPAELSSWDIIGLRNAYGNKPVRSLVGDRGMCADISGASQANGAAVIGFPCRGEWNDRFKRPSSSPLHFQSESNSRCLNVSGSVGPNNVIAWDCVESPNMDFKLSGVEWRAMGNMCVHSNGSFVELRTCSGSSNQKWDFFASGGQRRDQIQKSGTNQCVTITTTSGAMGQQLKLATCSSSDTKQRFTFPGNGRVRPANNSNLCANIAGGQPVTSGVVLWNGCGSTPPPNSVFTLHGNVKVGNFCMQTNGPGGQLTMRTCDGARDQVWDYHL